MRILLIGSSHLVHTTRLQQVEKKQSAVTVFGPPPKLITILGPYGSYR